MILFVDIFAGMIFVWSMLGAIVAFTVAEVRMKAIAAIMLFASTAWILARLFGEW